MNTNDLQERGLRNNNPGNIRRNDRDKPFIGEIRPSQDCLFRQFKDISYGYRAMFYLLRKYKKNKFNTIEAMIYRWAPPNDNNDTNTYIDFVCHKSGMDRYQPVDVYDKNTMCKIVAAMSQMENGVKANMIDVEKGWSLL